METNSHHPNSHPLLGRGDDPGEVLLCAKLIRYQVLSVRGSHGLLCYMACRGCTMCHIPSFFRSYEVYFWCVCVCTRVRACTCMHVHAHIGVHVSWCTCGGQRTYADISPFLPPCLGQGLSLSARQPGPQASRQSVSLLPISLEEHWMTNVHSTLSDSV